MESSTVAGLIRAQSGAAWLRIQNAESKMADVGYFDTGLNQGNATQADEIVELGHTAVNITDLSPATLATLKTLVIEHRGSGPVSAALLAAMPDILAAVAKGLVLVINDWSVTDSAGLFPAGSGLQFTRDYQSGGQVQMNLGPDGALIANSPHGSVTDTSLDNGNFSNHGYVTASSLPDGSKVLMTRDDPTHVTAFSYFHGLGAIVLTTVPVAFYSDSAAGSTNQWEDFYVNILNYALTLGPASEPENTAPVATEEAVTLSEGVATTINVLSNDTDAESDPLTITHIAGVAIAVGQTVTLASGSTVKLNANGTLTYTTGGAANNANLGQTATDAFTYTVSDGELSSSAEVTLTINGDYTRVTGTKVADTLNGTAFDDTINGLAGSDVLYGNAGNDILNGGGGGQFDGDRMYGGVGDDTYHVDSTRDLVGENLGEGHDRVISKISAYTLTANVEDLELAIGGITGTGNGLNNSLVGNAAANTLNGVGGNDELDGQGGNDTLYGGAGGDALLGGAGADTFIYKAASDSQASVSRPPPGAQAAPMLGVGANTDVIYDFNVQEGDKIDLTAIDASTRTVGNNDFVVVDAFTKVAGQMTVKTFGGFNMTSEDGAPLNVDTSIGYILEGDTNGDGQADFTLLFNAPASLTVNDLRASVLGVSAWNITNIGTHASAPSAIQTTIPDLFA